ncbi:MAG: hypothetical protein GX793_06015 [Bacteroidales bacterium]|jgi:hypothetical protein|nr:hypothetical protein [Bacteroidales bacterium]
MHSKRQEILVYIAFAIGFLAILLLNIKSGFSIDSILFILKDLAPLFISVMIFYMLNGFLFRSSDFEKTEKIVIDKIRQRYSDILADDTTKFDTETAQEYLFFKKRKTAFIPIQLLKEGILEIRVSYGTLDNFETISQKDEKENELRIENKKNLVKSKVVESLQLAGAKFKILENKKDTAVKIQFLPQSNYERILENVISETIKFLQEDKSKKV